jgi:hypothetical protein
MAIEKKTAAGTKKYARIIAYSVMVAPFSQDTILFLMKVNTPEKKDIASYSPYTSSNLTTGIFIVKYFFAFFPNRFESCKRTQTEWSPVYDLIKICLRQKWSAIRSFVNEIVRRNYFEARILYKKHRKE